MCKCVHSPCVCFCVRIKRSQWWWWWWWCEASFGADRRRHSLPKVISQGSSDSPSHAQRHTDTLIFFFSSVVLFFVCFCGILRTQCLQWHPASPCLCAISGLAGKKLFSIWHEFHIRVRPQFLHCFFFYLVDLFSCFEFTSGSPATTTWLCRHPRDFVL